MPGPAEVLAKLIKQLSSVEEMLVKLEDQLGSEATKLLTLADSKAEELSKLADEVVREAESTIKEHLDRALESVDKEFSEIEAKEVERIRRLAEENRAKAVQKALEVLRGAFRS